MEAMVQYKICKTCKTENELTKFRCVKCKSSVFEKHYKEGLQMIPQLKLLIEDLPVKIASGDRVGREAKGAKLLALMTTVSREHAQFIFEDGVWFIEDLNSSNGTYLENVENRIMKKTTIYDGEKLFLSRSVEMIIQIKGV
jgi:hypothetical protein